MFRMIYSKLKESHVNHGPPTRTMSQGGTTTLVVDGDGSEIPGLTKKSPNKVKRGQASKVRDQDEQ